jgi:hypothetical protein
MSKNAPQTPTREAVSDKSRQTAKSAGGQIPAGSKASSLDAAAQKGGLGRHVPVKPEV